MHIQWISIWHLPPLENVYLDCDERVNLFIGPNASGKSTILRAIKDLSSTWNSGDGFNDDNPYPTYIKEYSPGRVDIGVDYGDPQDISHIPKDAGCYYPEGADRLDAGASIWEAAPFLYIPAIRTALPRVNVFDHTTNETEVNVILEELFDTESGVFRGHQVENSIDLLSKLVIPDWTNDFERNIKDLIDLRFQEGFLKALQIGHSCARQICSEVIYDNALHPYVEMKDDGYNSPERVVHHYMGIGTTDNILGEPLYTGALSSGTQGTLLWIWALALKMASHRHWLGNWEEKPAVLLIDEIENHLHPTWQRRVIPALLEHFPGLQIFATTHSPFVVAGRKSGQVHLLMRSQQGRISYKPNSEDIIGWTADEILRTMMGVDDPTDDATAAAASELRKLREEGPRDTLEAEEQRQERIRELRQNVDRDLLAGGPWKAQRELFEQQFSQALEQYRQSKDLNQEDG